MNTYRKHVLFLIALVLVTGVSISLRAGAPVIELTVEARDMAFYLEGDPRPNPTIELERGRNVRIHFVNRDRGIQHDLLMPELGLSTPLLPGDGSRATLRFTTPDSGIDTSYTCSLHAAMMTADLKVR